MAKLIGAWLQESVTLGGRSRLMPRERRRRLLEIRDEGTDYEDPGEGGDEGDAIDQGDVRLAREDDGPDGDTCRNLVDKIREILADRRIDVAGKMHRIHQLINDADGEAQEEAMSAARESLDYLERRAPSLARRLLEARAGRGRLPRNGREFAARLRLGR